MTKYDDVKNISTEEYFKGNQFSIDAFNKKYSLLDKDTGEPLESYPQALKRVCDYVASVEETEELQTYWSERWFDEIYNDWWSPAGSIYQGAGSGRKISLCNCFARETRFITDKGVKSFENFSDGDNVNVLTNYGGFHPATVKSFGKQKLYNLVVCRNGVYKEIKCTKDHLWRTIVNKDSILVKPTSELNKNDRIPHISKKWMPNYENDRRYCSIGFIHGLVFGDGYYDKAQDVCHLNLFGDSKIHVELFSGLKYNCIEERDGYKISNLPNYMKRMPDFESVNSEYILGFFMGWFSADGTVDKSGRAELYHTNYDNLEMIKGIMEAIGIYSSQIRLVRDHNPYKIISEENHNNPLYGLHIIKDSLFDSFFINEKHISNWEKAKETIAQRERVPWRVESIQETNSEEIVWCVQVPEVENFTLEGGVNTHNCTTLSLGTGRDHEEWDSLESIIKNTAYDVAKCAAYRQGLGVDFSRLRPRDTSVLNSSNKSTGSIHWMQFIDNIAYYVGQSGRIPAFLFSTNIKHPDIEEFITVKSDYSKIQNANISVQVTNDFYKAVEEDKDWELRFEVPEVKKGDRVYVDVHSTTMDYEFDKELGAYYYVATHDRHKEVVTKIVSARKLLELIAKNMAENAEPGIQNIDIARKYSNSDYVYDPSFPIDTRIVSTNACSEQYLNRAGLCVLSSINMGRFSTAPEEYKNELSIIGESINRFLDNVNTCEVESQTYAVPHQRLSIEYLRRTGAGFTNMGEWIFKLDMEYGSEESNITVEEFVKWYNYNLYKSSIALGKEKGSFKAFNKEKFIKSPFIKRMMKTFPDLEFDTMRNVTLSSIAPTGSLSLMFRDSIMSYGIEPAFNTYYWKRTRIAGKYEYYFCVPSIVRKTYEQAGCPLPIESDTVKDTWDGKIGKIVVQHMEEHKKDLDIHFKDATEINPLDKLDLMSRVMKWVDSSISVTYMLPEKSTTKDVYEFIMEAYKREVKSIAAFPDKKMYGIVSFMSFRDLADKLISEGVNIHPQNFSEEELKELNITSETIEVLQEKTRPEELPADIYSITAKGEKFCLVVGLMNGQPYEIFGGLMNGLSFSFKKKHGRVIKEKSSKYRLEIEDEITISDFQEQFKPVEQIVFRLLSQNLRYGVPLEAIIKQLNKASDNIASLSSATARVLRKYLESGTKTGDQCPKCGNDLMHNDGCVECSCGYSRCS